MEKIIQWYPGHMAKAYRLIKEKIQVIDIIYEVIDSRCPLSSMNKTLKDTIGNKPHLLILNKCDLSDPKETDKWVKELEKNYNVLALNSLTGVGNLNEITKKTEEVLKSRGKTLRYPIRAMVIGIPNVGKSTLLNNIAKRRALNVGDRPGVTKSIQYLKANDKLLLLDNPGTLWPKFENEDQAYNIALIGSIKDEILPIERVAYKGLDILKAYYKNELINRFNLDNIDNLSNNEIFNSIAIKRGAILKGGEPDTNKAYDLFLRELRSAKIGRITLERLN